MWCCIMEAVITSDWHLDCFNTRAYSSYFPQRSDLDYQVAELRKPFEYAIDHGIRNVFVLGDIGDKHVLSVDAQLALLDLLVAYDGVLNTYIIHGNHDYSDINTRSLSLFDMLNTYKKFKTVNLFDTEELVIDRVLCRFLSYPNKEIGVKSALNLFHLDVNGAVAGTAKITRGIDAPPTYSISGHIHEHQVVGKTIYCGSPYQVDFGNKLPKGFLHIRAKSPHELRYKFINSGPRIELRKLSVNSDRDWSRLSRDKHHLYKIVVASHIQIPSTIRTDYPNILDISGRYEQPEQQEVAEIRPTDGLETFLFNSGLSDIQVNRGLSLVDEAMVKI